MHTQVDHRRSPPTERSYHLAVKVVRCHWATPGGEQTRPQARTFPSGSDTGAPNGSTESVSVGALPADGRARPGTQPRQGTAGLAELVHPILVPPPELQLE